MTTTAIIIGLVVGNVVKPGAGADLSSMVAAHVNTLPTTETKHGLGHVILNIIPDNIVDAMAKGSLLPVIFFAVMFGLGVASLPHEKKTLWFLSSSVSEAMFKVTHMIMAYSPIGIFGMIAVTVTNFGMESMLPLLKLIGTTYVTAILFVVIVFGLIARFIGINIFQLIRFMKAELVLAFSSASSTTVLPQVIQKLNVLVLTAVFQALWFQRVIHLILTARLCFWVWERCLLPRFMASICRLQIRSCWW